ncbi:MAG: SPFH domain-containing protein [Candidatus Diapherotrites archaeon]
MAAVSMKSIVFLVIFLALATTILLAVAYLDAVSAFFVGNIIWLLLLVVFVSFAWKARMLKIKGYERALIFRFSKFKNVAGPGWVMLLPFIDTYVLVDLRVKTLDVQEQDAVTKDSIEIKVDSVIYLKVKKDNQSVINSVLEVEDYQNAAKLFVISTIRDIIGGMPLNEVISRIEDINKQVHASLSEIAIDWGVEAIAVQIKDIDIPPTVLTAMHAQKAAVQEKLARMEKAEAQKAEIDAVKEAAEGLSDKALNYYYIKALEEMAKGRSTKVFFPVQFSNLAQSLGGKLDQKGGARIAGALEKAADKSRWEKPAEGKPAEKRASGKKRSK